MDFTGRCIHGWTRVQGCRQCEPVLDWREDYARRVYERGAAVPAVERDLDNPSPDPDRELNQQRGL